MKKLILCSLLAFCGILPMSGMCDSNSKGSKKAPDTSQTQMAEPTLDPTVTQEMTPQIPSTAPIPPPDAVPAPISYEGAFMKMLLCLVGLLLLVFFTVWVLRRLSQGRSGLLNSQRSIKILEKRSLSPKSVLYLIEMDGKKVLVSESQLEVRAIATSEKLP